jgi:hypothetical protein
MTSLSRGSFLKSAGVAAGAAAVSASPAVAAAIDPGAVEIAPTALIDRNSVVAILRDANRGEVTIVVGTTERTYKDRQLAGRLAKAARQNLASNGKGQVA